MHAIIINQKREIMNLKEDKKDYIEVFGERKGRGNYMIISRNKSN